MSGEVPDGWLSTTLGEMADITGGSTPSKAEPDFWEGGNVPWATPSDVTRLPLGSLVLDGQVSSFVTAKAISETSLRVLPVGSVLMTSRATIGFPAINSVPVTTNQGFANFLPNPSYDPDFLAQWIIHNRSILENAAGGSTFLEISKKTLRGLRIDLPPPTEQHRIAEILSSVDEAIQATQAVIEQTREVKDGVLERLLTKGIGHTRFKQTEIGEIPEGWEAKALGEVCDLSGGAGFPIKYQGRDDLPYPFIKVSDMNLSGNEKFIIEYNNTIDQDIAKALKARPFPKGATIFPKVGAALLTNKRRILTRPTFVDNNIMVANPSPELDSEYLYHCFCRLDFSEYVQSGAVPSINQGTVGAIPIPVPPLSEQKGIVDILRALDETEERLATEMAQRHQLKASLSGDLLTGRRRVSASLLLAAE